MHVCLILSNNINGQMFGAIFDVSSILHNQVSLLIAKNLYKIHKFIIFCAFILPTMFEYYFNPFRNIINVRENIIPKVVYCIIFYYSIIFEIIHLNFPRSCIVCFQCIYGCVTLNRKYFSDNKMFPSITTIGLVLLYKKFQSTVDCEINI